MRDTMTNKLELVIDDAKRLSPYEWLLMTVIWHRGEASVQQIQEDLETLGIKRDYNTTVVQLHRISSKRWIDIRREGRMNMFFPLIGEEQGVAAHCQHFIDTGLLRNPKYIKILQRVLRENL